LEENKNLKELKFDIKILKTIRQTIEEHLPWFTNSLESETGISSKTAKTIAIITECTFVMQIVNMIGSFNLYQVTALTSSSNAFIAENLFDDEGNFISKEKNSIIIKFVEPDNKDIISIPQVLFTDCFNLMRIPFYLFTAIYRKDKGTVRKHIRNVIKEYENKVEEAENLALSLTPPTQKLIYKIKKIIDSIDPLDISVTKIARRYGIPRQTFVEKIKKHHIVIDKNSWTLKDSRTGEDL
jgi:hypothetical protein